MESKSRINFPTSIIKGIAGDFAHLYSEYLESPIEFFYMSFITCLGEMISHKIKFKSELKTSPRLYTVLLGESAMGRKSTAITKTIDFFNSDRLYSQIRINVCEGASSGEGIQSELKSTIGKGNIAHSLLFYDEFLHLLSKAKIEGSVILSILTKLFDGESFGHRIKTNKIQVDSAHLSLLAACTHQLWESEWSKIGHDIGLINRIFIVPGHTNSIIAIPKIIPLVEKTKLRKILLREKLKLTNSTFYFNDEAKETFNEWYTEIRSLHSIHFNRLDEYLKRLCILQAFSLGTQIIDKDTVLDMIELCEWQSECRRLNDPLDADNKIALLEQKILQKLTGESLTRPTLFNRINAKRSGEWYFSTALHNLIKSGQINQNRVDKKIVFEINANKLR